MGDVSEVQHLFHGLLHNSLESRVQDGCQIPCMAGTEVSNFPKPHYCFLNGLFLWKVCSDMWKVRRYEDFLWKQILSQLSIILRNKLGKL